jgi:cell division protein FtsZ
MEFHRKAGEISALTTKHPKILVAGLGAAGANILRRIVMDGGNPDSLICIDTDLGTLNSCAAPRRVQIGRNLTRGLTAGGDPDLGREAAQESEQEIRQAFRGVDLVFLCTGLGGGTASGASPVIARLAREEGCFVLVFVTLPFHFEGRRRQAQAREALAQLKPFAGALLTFENDRMGQLIVPTEGVQKAFAVADATICHSIRAITAMLEKPGMIRLELAQLLEVLNGQDARCLFGFGKATGPDRATLAVKVALENPLLHEGDLVSSASTILVHISGNRSVTFAEAEQVMTEISSQVHPSTKLSYGVSASEEIGEELWVAIISSVSRTQAAPVVTQRVAEPAPIPPAPAPSPEPLAPFPVADPESVVPLAPLSAEEAPALVPPGPLKPRLKPPLPLPPAPAPIPNKPPPVVRRLIDTEHLDVPPSPDPKPPATPAPEPPAPARPVQTPGVQIEYTPNGNGGHGTLGGTITLEPPAPSFLNRDGAQQPPTPLPGVPPASGGVENGRPQAHGNGNGNGHGNGNGTPPRSSTPLSLRHRGRFENCEPTILGGQDLDIPTYLRMPPRPE